MKYVTCMGELFKMSDRAYRQLLRAVSQGEYADPGAVGGKSLGQAENVTDMDRGWAKFLLERENKR